ncbi:MAG: thiamine phosphate synthase [Firmicutes bacterium]|nr:thiamine phosphate synthase [Bacillota bacterium]
MAKFPQTDIYGITCEKLSKGRDNLEVVKQLLAAGVKIIQYREKEKTKKEKLRQCLAISKMCREAGALFIVNDDVDIAMLTEAGGIHVGQDDLPADAVRKLVGSKMLIGVSAGTPQEAAEAVARGADYLGIGPVFGTGTKEDAGKPVGLEFLKFMVQNYSLPLVAIGGINAENIHLVSGTGITCFAMVSALVAAEDIAAAVHKLRRQLKLRQTTI